MSASASSILPYRTRSRMIVSYDEDFGKVDWVHFKAPSEPMYEDSDFGKVNWNEVEKERVSNEVLNKAITLVARENVERVVVNAMLFSQQTEERIAKERKKEEAKAFDIEFTETYTAHSVKVIDENTRLWRMKSSEGQIYPFIFDRDIYEKDDVMEIVGYTTDRVNKEIKASDFKREWHPLMDEFIVFYDYCNEVRIRIPGSENAQKAWKLDKLKRKAESERKWQ